ncbi:hypothetical protein [Nocardiopsis sp. L17-MgMaSL7]|uniref:hypothetical protein n=1 Tax=Nocardiopsis sp. L17-MgMaSL7 TaxID=1938893 RepID=UPI000D711FB1|nr:hypothetical protein [Nocardiopsis sp. L17-MgMaSL7]PWV52958.1 hypothetical protein BDW27_105304 [Nocardiopsis sp. L17-MgMaSL7]
MSNPTIVTKLTTLVRGIFGRKDPVVTTVQDKKDETPAATDVTSEDTVKQAEKAEEKAETAPAAAAETPADAVTETPAETSSETAAEAAPEAAPKTPAETTSDAAPLVEEPTDEPSVPATADLPEDGPALAEELEAAEAHTTVASDDVLERVRKEAAPAAEDLAVPTYDELSLPSIRARLRKLTIEQVRDLRAYEVAHEARPEFIKMYDNRIAKLESEA